MDMRALENSLKAARILIVDDNVASVCLLQTVLDRLGFSQVMSTTDSRCALMDIERTQPDLIILDLNMPRVSGYDILQMLGRGLSSAVHLPVLVLTGDVSPTAKLRALASGATDFLNIPFDSSELFIRIRNLLKSRFLQLKVQEQNVRLEQRVAERTAELSEALSELRRTQEQMLRQERLHAFSEMAGGVVHDFNNALMSVIGYSELLLEDPETLNDHDTVIEYLRMVNTAGRDAAHVVGRLRDFYRPREFADVFASLDLNQLFAQVASMTQPRWKGQALAQGCTISVELDLADVPRVSANEAEIRELVTNLIFNAVDAMPDGGTITLRTRHCDEEVVCEVVDSGLGMSEEVRTRCLEPFFSTKGEKGTGLGLSMVFGAVRRHNGKIEIESEVGCGATFRIRFPVCTESAVAPTVTETAAGESLRVLVVDDDPVTRQIVTKYLEMDGHHAVASSCGADAIVAFQNGVFDLLVTDVAMPSMGGFQLMGALREMRPSLPVIVLTALSEVAFPVPQNSDNQHVIYKPVLRDTLRKAVRETTGVASGSGLAAIV